MSFSYSFNAVVKKWIISNNIYLECNNNKMLVYLFKSNTIGLLYFKYNLLDYFYGKRVKENDRKFT